MEDRLRKMGAEADRRIDVANAKTLAAEQRAQEAERALEKAREELSICQEDVSDLERLSEKDGSRSVAPCEQDSTRAKNAHGSIVRAPPRSHLEAGRIFFFSWHPQIFSFSQVKILFHAGT